MSSGFGGGGAGGGGGGIAGVVAAGAGAVSFGGADLSHAASAVSNSEMHETLIIQCVMAPRYHGPG
jgi:hypothetical protein